MFYHPGLLAGGKLEHDCSCLRSIGYFLEPLMMLAPFAKSSVCVTLRGLTSGPEDPSVSISLSYVLYMYMVGVPHISCLGEGGRGLIRE